ncbi:MAG: hypothetical protein AAF409_20200 [Pseudomonadota bacterium]
MLPYDGSGNDPLADHLPVFVKGSTEEMYRSIKDDPGLYFRAKYKDHTGKSRTPSVR